jgi:3',5'-cyclic AMP phosphodiesterase CpdA
MMATLNWLHLTDLHLGMKGSEDLWPNVEEDFFNDLRKLVKDERGPRVDPLDLVVFTGDLVQSGGADQFDEIDVVLEKLWGRFHEEMGFEPKLVVVPGNHDLTRPPESTGQNPNPALDTLTHLWHLSHVYDAFWDPGSVQRELVNRAFTNYVDWWEHTPIPKPEVYWKGELPGDFSATVEEEGIKLGIVGLNSTFLQLTDGDREGELALSERQFNLACAGHGPDWAAAHNVCLLLTHHPPEWLTEAARGKLVEIHKPPRFALHLFGHVHEADLTDWGQGGTQPLRRLQGNSLFSLEWLSSGDTGRRHGYSLGQLKVADDDSDYAELRVWPRSAERLPGGRWDFGQDRRFGELEMDSSITPKQVAFRRRLRDYAYPEDQPPAAGEEQVIEPVAPSKEKRFQRIDPAIAATDPILIARLDMLQQKLSRIPRWLKSDLEKLGVEKSFKKTLLDKNIGQPLNSQENALGDIYRALNRLDPDDNEAVSEALKDAWSSYQKVYRRSQEIFRDCLELMGGLALRDKELDERICEVADELINATTDYVRTSWYSFTILAQREAFQWTISRIIRLRFPEWTIWSLPFAAHEFGHVVIRDEDMFKELVEAQTSEWKKRHLNVILADAFATYVMGPAYLCAAISLWLDPSGFSGEDDPSETSDETRLSDATRAHVMFAVLERMNIKAQDDIGEEPYTEIIDLLAQRWEAARSQQDASSEESLEEIQLWDNQDLEALVETALRELDDWLYEEEGAYPHSGENGIKVAEAWAAAWQKQLSNGERLSIPELSPNSTLRDALNAAWLCRIRVEPDKVDLVAKAAYQLCEQIIGQKTADAGEPAGRSTQPPARRQLASRRQVR